MRKQIKVFEDVIDKKLENLISHKYNGYSSIRVALSAIETSYMSGNNSAARFLRNGLNILMPYLIKSNEKKPFPKANQLFKDFEFASHYFMLRDFLYYSYNMPDSINWNVGKRKVKIKFNDNSIPRQFYLIENNYILKSMELTSVYTDEMKNISSLLKDREEFTKNPKDVQQIMNLIEQEAELKLKYYYNFLNDSDMKKINLGTYTLYEMFKVVKSLLVKALYHRYHSYLKNNPIPVFVDVEELINALSHDLGLDTNKCKDILMDISYKKEERIDPVYFSLYFLDEINQIIISPHLFCTWEAYVNILRIIALRNPRLFQETISPALSDNFVNHISDMFSSQGFKCQTNVKLNQFDPSLPDIDLFVVSEEPLLGYVIYCCEIKNPIPAQWAKDHLRVLNKDSVIKSFDQIEKIQNFLKTEQGLNFIRNMLPNPKDIPENLNGEFLILMNHLVITSNNSGMFFSEKKQVIIDYTTLGKILEKCDGDIAYIMKLTNEFNDNLDNNYSMEKAELKIDGLTVNYEGVALKNLVDFPPNKYKSSGDDKKLLEEFVKHGHHPFDMFEERPFKDTGE